MTAERDRVVASSSLGEREFRFTQQDFRKIALMLHADAGITLTEVKAPLVYSRLVKRLRTLGLENFRQYCDLVAGRNGAEERGQMMAALTTNVTRFLREQHHFDHLKTCVLPPLLEKARKGGRVRIWSAGCSTGEEPYSIGITILSLMPDAARFDIRVLATDINALVIEQGRRGVYPASALDPLTRDMRSQWFVSRRASDGGKLWRASEDLRRLVAFRRLNLMDPWPMRREYQAIFCRNVVIYFDNKDRQPIWSRMADLLSPAGYLYIGHSERITGVDNRFQLQGPTTYQVAHSSPARPGDMTQEGDADAQGL